MKCISLKQPYAEMLAIGKKIVECRKWCTKFRGDFLIHASKNVDIKSCNYYNIDKNSIIKGAIIGKANLYDVKKYSNYKDFLLDADKHLSISIPDDKIIYGFLIKDAAKLEQMIPYKGKLGFFDVNLLYNF
ncbi:MAG: ASCH domain-containing protein [Candidatus Nitrosocosmicus sp.]